MEGQEFKALFDGMGPKAFAALVKMAVWAADAEQHGLELAYQDDELMLFRRKVPLTKLVETQR
jgi:hypothetical protein